ncbi:MAG: hypothetical protein AAFQ22_07155 [Pseudomonadota bacterium]
MSVREAVHLDMDFIIHHGRRFYEYGPWADVTEFSENNLRASLSQMIESPDACIFVNDHGICGGLIFPLYFNHSYRIAQELFWWADEGGEALREAFEDWAHGKGAHQIQMTCLADEHEPGMRRLLRAKGYAPFEVSLLKEVH